MKGSPLFASNLPQYTGQYDVGTIDLEVPCDSRKISEAVFKANGEPAFQVRCSVVMHNNTYRR